MKMIVVIITTLHRSVNARRQQAPKHAVAENHGKRGRSSTAAKSTLFSSEGAELAVFFPKTRFRVGGVANGISDFSVKKPISVFDRIEKLGRAARKLMFTSFPVHSEATQQLLQTWFFQHANASQSSNMHGLRSVAANPRDLEFPAWSSELELCFGHGCSGNRTH